MTWDQALQIIIEDGIELGAGDYVDLEALKLAAKALDLQVEKEPINQQGDPLFGYCPTCGSAVYKWLNRVGCKECLQRLKWRE